MLIADIGVPGACPKAQQSNAAVSSRWIQVTGKRPQAFVSASKNLRTVKLFCPCNTGVQQLEMRLAGSDVTVCYTCLNMPHSTGLSVLLSLRQVKQCLGVNHATTRTECRQSQRNEVQSFANSSSMLCCQIIYTITAYAFSVFKIVFDRQHIVNAADQSLSVPCTQCSWYAQTKKVQPRHCAHQQTGR